MITFIIWGKGGLLFVVCWWILRRQSRAWRRIPKSEWSLKLESKLTQIPPNSSPQFSIGEWVSNPNFPIEESSLPHSHNSSTRFDCPPSTPSSLPGYPWKKHSSSGLSLNFYLFFALCCFCLTFLRSWCYFDSVFSSDFPFYMPVSLLCQSRWRIVSLCLVYFIGDLGNVQFYLLLLLPIPLIFLNSIFGGVVFVFVFFFCMFGFSISIGKIGSLEYSTLDFLNWDSVHNHF